MHLVYVTAALPYGSVEAYIVPEILELMKRGHQVTVIPVRPLASVIHKDAQMLNGSTIGQPVLSPNIVLSALAETMRSPLPTARSARSLTASRNGLLFIKNAAVFPKALWLARIVRQQGVDHIHAHWAATSATVAMVASAVSGIPWSLTAHRWDIPENNLLDKKAQTARFVRTIDVQGMHELSNLISPHRDKLRVIHMGVDLHPPSPKREEVSTGSLRVLLGARLVEVKGHRYALEAMAQLKANGVDVFLHCAGDGPLQANMEEYADELGISDRVRFLGLVDHLELLDQLRDHRWDVALLPSIVTKESKEGIPVFLIEAMAAGIPVVATDTGGISELLSGDAGLLIPSRDSTVIANALARLAADSDLRHQLSEAGMRRVRDEFTIESTVSALLEGFTP
jgi:colanic acid/amylovoran biosynthesis glycosyltransferase